MQDTDVSHPLCRHSISAHPASPWYIIINPNSGPGSAPQPDAGYAAGIKSLRAAGDVTLLGYVATTQGRRMPNDVIADIDTYHGWAEDVAVDGIFFDETGADMAAVYRTYAQHVKDTSSGYVILNPGSAIGTEYFDFVDQIVTLESYASDFTG